jgi:pimeloyl-ACP methyl ester carboxylesterase
MGKTFRSFADQTKSDRRALAACIRGTRQVMPVSEVAKITMPVLIAAGTKDDVAGPADKLAVLMPHAQVLDIPGRDHMLAVGDKVFKSGVLKFLNERA